jgi:hypothetical protein
MAKTFEELEEEEMLERKKKLAGMQTLKDFRKEEERQKKANLRLSKVYDEQVYKPFLAGRTPQQVVAEKQASQKAQRTADVEKAREDMRSGKTSSLVGKAGQEGDPYAGKGKSPITFKSQAEADRSGLTRYNLDEPKGFAESQQRQGPVEARKATGSKQVFKAMVQGDPTQDQVFDTKKEAEDYLKSKGVKGAVAGVRMTGGSGEEIKAKESKYREQAGSAAKKEKELKALYDKRRTAAQERMDRVSKGEIGAREAGIESQIEDIAETSPKRARQFETGLQNIEDKRAAREAAITSQRIRNVAEGKAGMPFGESDRITKMENRANRRERDLRSMYEKAVKAGNFDLAMKIEDEIKSTIGTDPRSTESRRRFFKQKLSRANPF